MADLHAHLERLNLHQDQQQQQYAHAGGLTPPTMQVRKVSPVLALQCGSLRVGDHV